VPHLLIGQVLWLPSPVEMEIHRRTCFSKRQQATPQGNNQPSMTAAAEPPTQPQLKQEIPEQPSTQPVQVTDPTDEIYVRPPGDATGLFLDPIVLPEVIIQVNDMSMPQSADSANLRSGSAFAPPSILQIMQAGRRPTVTLNSFDKMLERIELLKRLDRAAPSKPVCVSGPQTLIDKLHESARIVTSETPGPSSWFSAKLQILIQGRWETAAAYQYQNGRASLNCHHANGNVQPMQLDLPAGIVREMAREDFNRNWEHYLQEFNRQCKFNS
jgi:hypothetical protein